MGIMGMTRMQELYLEDLELEGRIMPELFTDLSKLERLHLGENYFSSVLPEELGSAKSLGRLQYNYYFCFEKCRILLFIIHIVFTMKLWGTQKFH